MGTAGALRRPLACANGRTVTSNRALQFTLTGNILNQGWNDILHPTAGGSCGCGYSRIGEVRAFGASTIVAGGSGSMSGTGGANSTVEYRFDRPIDIQLTLGSFSQSFGERLIFLTGCDEFVAGAQSNLATNPAGYGPNTQYFDNNAGGSVATWRDTLGFSFRVLTNPGLTCGFTPALLKYHVGCQPDTCP